MYDVEWRRVTKESIPINSFMPLWAYTSNGRMLLGRWTLDPLSGNKEPSFSSGIALDFGETILYWARMMRPNPPKE